MESEWRYGVAAEGMWGTNWRLAARFPPPNAHLVLVAFSDGPADRWIIYEQAILGDVLTWVQQVTGTGPGHFPYGWVVVPD